jgi:hypothetical protein
MARYELTQFASVRAILRNRWPQLLLQLVAVAGLLLVLLAALVGTPVGSRNFGMVAVWIGWWAVLMILAVPAAGRGWCAICPLPLPGEWLQRRSLLGPQGPAFGLGLRWPRRLRNLWPQNVIFAAVAVVSAVVLTQPRLTGLVLAGLILAAIAVSLVFERRSFCRYLCPVGGFIGLYAQAAPIGIRVKDTTVCASHREKTCYTGSDQGYGCPWQVYPGALARNSACGLCLECLRTCPHDNVAVVLRTPGSDLSGSSRRGLDEAFKGFLMLGSAAVYAAVMLGPWGALKSAAAAIGAWSWAGYAAGLLLFAFSVLPGTFLGAVLLGRRVSPSAASLRNVFSSLSAALVPLGLSAWVAFSLAFALVNLSYLWPALSDPMGWGWDLLGTAGVAWTPYLSSAIPGLQALVLLGGLGWSAWVAVRMGRALNGDERIAWPVVGWCVLMTVGLLWLLVG